MNSRFTIVETSLNRAEFRWKWLRLLQHSFALGAIICLLSLLAGVAMLGGWLTDKFLASAFFVLLAAVAFIAWIVIIISVAAGAPNRSWLAAAIERVRPQLLDRLNTLLFLERRPADARTQSFAMRIARQTQNVIAEDTHPSPFQATRPWAFFVTFLVLLLGTILLYDLAAPWKRLRAAERANVTAPAHQEKPLELGLPPTNNAEQDLAWGEVRITDPGEDLKVTKVDVVPLQIEAAANQAIKSVGWYSTVNGTEETSHTLPAPTEPRYAVYQPTLYLDELQLSDWDVMTYYAKADANQNSFASEVYFLEVRPFREDILKMPGGENGKAYQCLNEMTAFISRQQHIIRQTHQHLQKPAAEENLKTQDRKKLSEAESDLRDAAQHLYAKMAGEMENQPIAEALDNLAQAESSLDRASKLLQDDLMSEAQKRERTALAELVAARKIFQKSVSDNPKAFDEPKDEEASPVAESSKKLSRIAEFRNEAKTAQEFIQKTLEQQRSLEQRVRSRSRSDYPSLGEQEKQLENSLADFQAQHPQAFKDMGPESQEAQQAMSKAADALEKRAGDARASTSQATQQLDKFNQALTQKSAEQQLANSYKLKQMLDQEIRTLGQCAQPGSQVSNAELGKTASEARQTVSQLKQVAEQEPTRDAFGPALREALSGQKKVDIDARLSRLQQLEDNAAKQQGAGEARDALAQVSKAFEASQPKAMQAARKSDSLKPDEKDSFNAGMGELESLLKQLENSRPVSSQDLNKQGQEAMSNLQAGMRAQYGDNVQGRAILLRLQELLRGDEPINAEGLKKLMDELQHFSVETTDRLANKDDKPEVTNIDPTRLPPAYRGRIQKYFQKLSEK